MEFRHYLIHGRVQGVWFRAYTRDHATRLGVRGWVRNLRNGGVEAVAAADVAVLGEFEALLRVGPERGRVDEVQIAEMTAVELPSDFTIRPDSDGTDATDQLADGARQG